ncbi:CRTAC1 family protein [Halobaculum sp. CBA1158]|uniref:CRTAC1 family protein n=1 Tax=Halobaculum sp. CBA1158 TaxID=2904243 RepID=UPI001F44B356|nr:CRTAC1 family protein [Halobaculum sp. CBA1158]UIO99146.1 CRTAC1 family protein [Halobaculum sp. CBA1158]
MFADRSDALVDDAPHRGYGVAVTPGVRGPCALVTGYGPANRLLTWRDGALRDVATPAVADEGRHAIGVVAADLDADGDEELYVHNTDAYEGECRDTDLLLDPVEVRPDHPEVRWRDLFGLAANADRGNFRAGRSVAALDRYGTGRYGVFVACYGVPSRFYELGDDGQLSDMAEAVGLDLDAGARSLYAGPVASDRMDLFVGVERGPNRLFYNDSGHFREVAADAGVADPETNARGVVLADGDLAVGNWETESRLYSRASAPVGSAATATATGEATETPATGGPTGDDANAGDPDAVANGGSPSPEDATAAGDRLSIERFVDAAPASFAEPTRIRNVVAADFDNDGRIELFCNTMGARNRLFRRGADGWRAIDPGDAAEARGLGTGAAVADFDGDGALELLVVHGELAAQPLSLYGVDDAAERGWIRVRPTTQYGAPARGATVTVETAERSRTAVVCAGSGYLCQMEPVAHFGLGDERPERLTVRWPDGREATLERPAERTEHEVSHPMAPRF